MLQKFNSWFRNQKMTSKLALGQGAIVAVLLFLSVLLGIQGQVVQNQSRVAAKSYETTILLRQVQMQLLDMSSLVRGVLVTGNDYLAGIYKNVGQDFDRDIELLIAAFEGNEAGQNAARELKTTVNSLRTNIYEKQLQMMTDPAQQEQARKIEIDGESWPYIEKVLTTVNDLVEKQQSFNSAKVDEMYASFTAQTYTVVFASVLAVLLAIVCARFVGNSISKPIQRITDIMKKLAAGDRGFELPEAGRKDEIGDMIRAVDFFARELERSDQLADERDQAQKREIQIAAEKAEAMEQQQVKDAEDARALAERTKAFERSVEDFSAAINEALTHLDASGDEMRQTSDTMVVIASNTGESASAVSDAAGDMQNTVSGMASAIEECSASIREVSNQVRSVNSNASEAMKTAKSGSEVIVELSDTSKKIQEVVHLITDIAEQTNLLALNATIEAARAGEAGKGFAVVASEVKNLATQTGRATEEISAQIQDMQTKAENAVTVMEDIDGRISELSRATDTITGVIEEQETATSEISRSVQMASEKTKQVREDINGVSAEAKKTGGLSNDVKLAAEKVDNLSKTISKTVMEFLAKVKVA